MTTTTIVHTVEVPARDSVYIFASDADAARFVDALLRGGLAYDDLFESRQTVCDSATTDALIASELED